MVGDSCSVHLITDPAGSANEDRVGNRGRFAWVIDGATGVNGKHFLPAHSDAAWIAEAWDSALFNLALDYDDPTSLIFAVHERVQADFQRHLHGASIAVADLPALALSLVGLSRDRLAFANIGDCSIVLRAPGVAPRRFGSSEVDRFDALALDVFKAELQCGAVPSDAATAARRQVVQNRGMANVEGGYWIIDPSDRWCDQVQSFDVSAPADFELLVGSDGFMRIQDVYGVVAGYEALLDWVRADGLQPVIDRIRDIEGSDPECCRHPRLKPADDASAVFLRPHKA